MNQYSENAPGSVFAVIKNGKFAFSDCSGLADVSLRIPITPTTNFRLASLSKQFTAMAIMILKEQKCLSYEDQLGMFFPDFFEQGKRVTIRNLLTHTSGMPDHEKPLYRELKPGKRATMQDARLVLQKKRRLLFPAGTKYQYSDAGFVVLAMVIEAVTGMSYREFVRQEIFVPLRMADSDVLDETNQKIRNRALGYRTKIYYTQYGRITDSINHRLSVAVELSDDDPLNFIVGDEGVYSSIEDMGKWSAAWESEALVTLPSLQEAFTPQPLNNGSEGKAGFSWLFGQCQGKNIVYQDGSWVGFRNIILRIPDERTTVIILSNRTDLDSERQRLNAAMTILQKAIKT